MTAAGMGSAGDEREINRRQFCKSAAMGLGGFVVLGHFGSQRVWTDGPGPLVPPVLTGRSTEICMNSRVSRHSGLGGTATEQQISNILWGAGRAPCVGTHRTIYLTTPVAKYIYHPEDHSLEYYSSETVSNALRITYDRELDFDAGVSYVLALWASVSLWSGTSSQVASCPQQANLNYGIAAVPGLTNQLVAFSSNASLPDPITDGSDYYEEVLGKLRLQRRFRSDLDVSPQRLSQVLWAGYGCTPHMTANNRAGLTVPSWVAEYFLTNRIYVVQDKVARYANRTGSNLATRDHRLDLVQNADVRAAVRQALPELPAAPCYVLLCLTQSGLGSWYQRLETGFVAGGMLAQAGALGVGCAFHAALASPQQQALQQITQIPAGDFPHAVVALGHRPADLDGDGDVDADDLNAFGDCMAGPNVAPGPGCDAADVDRDGDVDLHDMTELQKD